MPFHVVRVVFGNYLCARGFGKTINFNEGSCFFCTTSTTFHLILSSRQWPRIFSYYIKTPSYPLFVFFRVLYMVLFILLSERYQKTQKMLHFRSVSTKETRIKVLERNYRHVLLREITKNVVVQVKVLLLLLATETILIISGPSP